MFSCEGNYLGWPIGIFCSYRSYGQPVSEGVGITLSVASPRIVVAPRDWREYWLESARGNFTRYLVTDARDACSHRTTLLLLNEFIGTSICTICTISRLKHTNDLTLTRPATQPISARKLTTIIWVTGGSLLAPRVPPNSHQHFSFSVNLILLLCSFCIASTHVRISNA